MVSILVPVYNTAPYLRECVQSLTGQTYADLQIVLINDGSTDESWDILQELAAQDKRLEIYSQPNYGVAATRNHLLDKARGEFVLFVDSDDWIELDTIATLVQEQKVSDYDMVTYQLSIPLPEDDIYTKEQSISHFLEHRIFRGSLCDKLIRRELFDGLSIDQTVSYGEDALLVWQILQRVRTVRVLGRVFYHYRENQSSISRQSFNGKKFSAYTTWETISRETDLFWPEYSDIAHARFACEMTQILKSAATCGYPCDAAVKLLQESIRRYGRLIRKTGVSSLKMWLYSWLVSHNYWLASKLSSYIK